MAAAVTTYLDAIENLMDFTGNNSFAQNQRFIKRAVQAAYEQLTQDHRWSYYRTLFGFVTDAAESGTTLTYVHSTRTATLSGSDTWPSWAANGTVRVGSVNGEIISRTDSTNVVLADDNGLGADISTAKSYTVFRDQYPLPFNVRAFGALMSDNYGWISNYTTPDAWLRLRSWDANLGEPYTYTYKQSEETIGTMVLCLYPAPDTVRTYDTIIVKAPRAMVVSGTENDHSVGTVTIASGTGVTGSSTNFNSRMVGSIIRFGGTTNKPTGLEGTDPYINQRTITAVGGTTSLTLNSAVSEGFSGAKYVISDPVDIDPIAAPAFEHLCRLQIIYQSPKDYGKYLGVTQAGYQTALMAAKMTDQKDRSTQVTGGLPPQARRLRSFPSGDDVP